MSNNFVSAVKKQINSGFTTNGDVAYTSTGSELLNMFGSFGSLRTSNELNILNMFKKAFSDNSLDAMKLLFYFRDIREGQGERRPFQIVIKWLADNHPSIIINNLENIVEFGYWKDLYHLMNTQLEYDVINFWIDAILNNNLLAAKYAPTESQSVKDRTDINKFLKIVKMKGLSPKDYRKTLSALRSTANIVEKLMSENKFGDINYEHVPSLAATKYRKAFSKKDAERYVKYLSDVKLGVKKINATATNPVALMESYGIYSFNDNETIEMQWKSLKNPFLGDNKPLLVVADTSGSMSSKATDKSSMKDVAMALTVFCSERLSDPYKNMFMVFSNSAKFQQFPESYSVREKFNFFKRNHEVANTNFDNVSKEIIKVAKKAKLNSNDIPNLLVITDAQFDSIVDNPNTALERFKSNFESAGFAAPKVVFWNLNAKVGTKPVYKSDTNTMLISGYSPNILKTVLENIEYKEVTPLDLMNAVLQKERYSVINL